MATATMQVIKGHYDAYKGHVLYKPSTNELFVCTSYGSMKPFDYNGSARMSIPRDGTMYKTGNSINNFGYKLRTLYAEKARNEKLI
jgi:hypothetical protein